MGADQSKPLWMRVNGKPVKFPSIAEAAKKLHVSENSLREKQAKARTIGESRFMYKKMEMFIREPTEIIVEPAVKEEPKRYYADKSRVKSRSLLPGLDCYLSGRNVY